MSGGIRQFTLTSCIKHRILSRRRQHMAERQHLKPLWRDQNTAVRCYDCGQLIGLGKPAVSRAYGGNYRIQYHARCARRLNII